MRLAPAALVLAALLPAAVAAEQIPYGSRVGQQVEVRHVSGIGTDHARIDVEHTPDDAQEFCVEYLNDETAECVSSMLRDTHLEPALEGNCTTGRFTVLRGWHLWFVGEYPNRGMHDPKYLIRDEKGEALDVTNASGYGEDLEQFRALCPARVSGTAVE